MNNILYKLLCIFVFLCIAFTTYAQEADNIEESISGAAIAEESRVGKITIEGLKRTKEHVIRQRIGIVSGDVLTEDVLENAVISLFNTGLFSDVTVEVSESQSGVQDLTFVIKDKWSLIPLPVFSSSDNSIEGGVVLLESNFLGRGKFLNLGFIAGTRGISTFGAFSDPSIAGSKWGLTVGGSYGLSDAVQRTPNNEKMREYTVRSIGGRIAVSYLLYTQGPLSIDIAAGTGVSYMEISDFKIRADATRLPENILYSIGNLNVRAVKQKPFGPYFSGFIGEISQTTYSSFSTPKYHDGSGKKDFHSGAANIVQARGAVFIPLPALQRIQIFASGAYSPKLSVLLEEGISSSVGGRTQLNNEIYASRWVNSAAYYEIPVLNAGFGAIVLSHYWETGIFDAVGIGDPEFYYGPGGAFRIYLRQVAIPALGIDYAYDLIHENGVFSIALGMSM